jgi:hypothetical protein
MLLLIVRRRLSFTLSGGRGVALGTIKIEIEGGTLKNPRFNQILERHNELVRDTTKSPRGRVGYRSKKRCHSFTNGYASP